MGCAGTKPAGMDVSEEQPVLAFALGGSSDVIGALALANAMGSKPIVLVQPGSPSKSAPIQDGVLVDPVTPAPTPAVAPGGAFYDNPTMLAYLMATDAAVTAGYYLQQPKDEGGGFSKASLAATTEKLVEIARKHGCTSVVGLDFGGDGGPIMPSARTPDEQIRACTAAPTVEPILGAVVLDVDRVDGAGGCFIKQRDMLNLRAATDAAAALRIERLLVAVSPGVVRGLP